MTFDGLESAPLPRSYWPAQPQYVSSVTSAGAVNRDNVYVKYSKSHYQTLPS